MPPPLRLGIAGAGNVLDAYLAAARRLHLAGKTDLVALSAPERHRARARDLGFPHFHASYTEFLERPDLDLVVILTPMPTHAAMAAAALASGRHVLVEKPMACTLEDADALLRAAQDAHRHLVAAPFTTLSPTFREIDRRIRRGDLGRVVAARGRYGWAGPDWSDWFYRPGGGALFDLAVYNLTTLTGWLGPVRRVVALSRIAIPERVIAGRTISVEAEDTTQLILEFASGCLASVLAGFTLQQYAGPGIELYGTEGTLNLRGDDWDPDGFDLWQNAAGCWQCFKETHPDWPWADGLAHLVDCLLQGREPAVRAEHAYHVLEIMVRCQEAARDGCARTVTSTFRPVANTDVPPAGSLAAHRVHDRTRGGE